MGPALAAAVLVSTLALHGCMGPMDRLIQRIDAASAAAHARAPVEDFSACIAGTAAAIGMANVRVSVMWGTPPVAARSYCFRAE